MKPLSLLLWVAQRLTVNPQQLDLNTFTEAELDSLCLELGLAGPEEAHSLWREVLELVEKLNAAEPFPCEVVKTRKGFRLAHRAFGPQTAEWCLAQAAGYLQAALACYRQEQILRPDIGGKL